MAAPLYPRIEINGGVAVTASNSLTLTLYAVGATEMIVDTTASFQNATWQPYVTSMLFSVTAVSGVVAIYARFRNESKETTPIVSAMITIDVSQPQIVSLSVDGGSTVVRKRNVILTISTRGVNQVQILGDITNPISTWTTKQDQYSLVLTSKEGQKVIYVYGRNDALTTTSSSVNFSYEVQVDTQPPLIPQGTGFLINNGTSITYSADVVINMAITGATYMRISENPKFVDAGWEPYNTLKLFTLSNSYGTKVIYGEFKNDSGNTSTTSSFIYYDVTPVDVEDFKVMFVDSVDLFTLRVGFNRVLDLNEPLADHHSALNLANYSIVSLNSGDNLSPLELTSVVSYTGSSQIVVLRTVKQSNVKYQLTVTNVFDTNQATILAGDGVIEFQGNSQLSYPPVPPTIISITYEKTPDLPIVSWMFNTAYYLKGISIVGRIDGELLKNDVDGKKQTFKLNHIKLLSKNGSEAISTNGSYEQFQEARVDFYITGTDIKLNTVDASNGIISFVEPLTSQVFAAGIFVSYYYLIERTSPQVYETEDEQIGSQVTIYEEGTNKLVVDSGIISGNNYSWVVPNSVKLVKGKSYYVEVRTQNVENKWSGYSAPKRYEVPALDTVKPIALYAYAVMNKYVNIVFSKAIDSEFANVTGNYWIDGLIITDAVLLSDSKTVALTTAQQQSITYKLTMFNITDLAGNVMDTSTILFQGTSYSKETPLYISYARSLNEYTLEVVFNKPVRYESSVDALHSAGNVANYKIIGLNVVSANLIVEAQAPDGNNIGKKVILTTSIQSSRTYVLSVTNLVDAYQQPIVSDNSVDFLGQDSSVIVETLRVVYATSLNTTQFEVGYNKQVELIDAENIYNYATVGLNLKNVVLQPDKQTVIIDTDIQRSLYYVLQVTGVTDYLGNVILYENGKSIFKGTSPDDVTGPVMVKASSKNLDHIDVTFDKPMDEYSATDITNYMCNNGLTILDAKVLSNRTVVSLITTTQQLITYAITVSAKVKDVAGNSVQVGFRTTTFTANIFGLGIDPSLFPAPGVTCSPNSSWWMVIRENESGQILLSEGDIRFCDFDQLPTLLLHDNTWIPIMYFGNDGQMTSVDPATPFSFVAISANDLQVVNRNGGIATLNQHVNDSTLHQERSLVFPFVGNVTALSVNKEALRIESPTERSGLIGIKSTVVGGNGVALYGTSSMTVFKTSDIPVGVGIYVDGEGADILIENGKIGTVSGDGTIVFGNGTTKNSLYVVEDDDNGGAIEVSNIKSVGTVDFNNINNNAIGIYGGYHKNNRTGIMGTSRNNVGILADGFAGDVYLKHGTIVSRDLKAAELYVDGVKLTANGKYAPHPYPV